MRRWMILAAAVLAITALTSERSMDVAELKPVELLYVYREDGKIWLMTDTEDLGSGVNLEDALEDLKASADGAIFLDTADYLVIAENATDQLSQLMKVMRPGTEVCVGVNADTEAAAFLSAHSPEVTLNDIRCGRGTMPLLIRWGERYHLVKEADR